MYLWALLLFILALPSAVKAFREFQKQRTEYEIEKSLPEVLLLIGSLPSFTPFEKLIASAASSTSAASLPFKKTEGLILAGMPVQAAILTAFSGHSPVVRKSGELMYKLYANGNSMLVLLRDFALDLARYNEVKERAKADASLQKYSLLISSAFLVPLIMAFIHSISLRASTLLPMQQDISPAVVLLAINIYLVAFSFLSAKFISRQFSTHFITFFSVTAPLSLLIFNFASLLLT